MTQSLRSITLQFAPAADDAAGTDALRGQLSGLRQIGRDLWLASDEANTVERLSPQDDGTFGDHASLRLADCVALPADEEEEIDIEGLDFDGRNLWVVGSHGLKRKKPKKKDKDDEGIARLAELRADGNRYLLARIPMEKGEDGRWLPLAQGGARLMGSDRGNVLIEALRTDEHLAPFLAIPSKDNGLDIEGIAVGDDRVLLGLRGPVLRGWAIILELRLVEAFPGLLGLGPLEDENDPTRPYRKHFLDLRGLGVRDLCRDGKDLLVLAGPTMDLDGPAAVYRWKGAFKAKKPQLLLKDDLEEVIEVPYGTGEHDAHDHPEGISLFRGEKGEKAGLLVVYDSPDRRRQSGSASVAADVFPLR